MIRKKIEKEDWWNEGVSLYGEDFNDWEFICPACGTVQKLTDFLDLGMNKEKAVSYVGYSCIGRFEKSTKGCDWTLGGLFQIHELEVEDEEGKTSPIFEFATEENIEKYKERREKVRNS